MPLVINSLGGGHADMQTHTHIHTAIDTKTILRNQVSTCGRLAPGLKIQVHTNFDRACKNRPRECKKIPIFSVFAVS